MSLILVLTGGAQAQPTTTGEGVASAFQERLARAARLYEELEYEQALASLADAKALARTDTERSDALIYEGIVLADLRQKQQSVSAFRQGLLLRPDAALPIKVSPKVRRDFEAVRDEVRGQLGLPLEPARPPVATSDRPELPAKTDSDLAPVAAAASHPELEASLTAPAEPASKVRALPLTFAGLGVLTAGVGGYFGLLSRGNIQKAREATTLDAQREHLDSARGEALGANVLFGVAAAAVTGALILYLTGDSAETVEARP